MERIPDSIALTSTEAASLLDAHPSSVKRWCNDSELASELTPGGHRRISIHSVMTFARERGIETILGPFHPYEPHVWTALKPIAERGSFRELIGLAMLWVRRGDFERLEHLFLTLGRADFLGFAEFCDGAVRGLLSTIGHEWELGRLRVGDEHMVTEAITGALLALRREWLDHTAESGAATPGTDHRPVAVVGTAEGNQHAIGALCIRMILEREGWRVLYPGADLPTEDFAFIQKSREASLVCISLPPNGSLGDVTRALSILREYYDRARPYAVAFGGPPALSLDGEIAEEPFESVAFYSEGKALQEAVRHGLGGPRIPQSPPLSAGAA
jgi:methylmalonyl-CoA mutase cobalamin-binding subunit